MSAAFALSRGPDVRDRAADCDYVTMTLAGQLFGIPVLRIRDVLGAQRIARIPLAPPWVAGALNLRGRIVTAIDMRRRLGLPRSEHDRTEMSIVIEHGDELYSLIVDEVGDVLTCPVGAIGPNPPTLDPIWREISMGIVRLEARLLVILDVKNLFDLGQQDNASQGV